MTTIAFDGETISCDTLMVDGSTQYLLGTKILSTEHFLIAGSGEVYQIQRAYRSLENTDDKSIQSWRSWDKDMAEDIRLLVISKRTGKCWLLVGGELVKCPRTPIAIGSGGDVAVGAMMMGATSREAVKIASKIDVYTGGKIKTVRLLSQRKEPE